MNNKVEAISNYFIFKGFLDGNPINPMKLQKLLYYSYGWYYSIYNTKLFDQDFTAFEYGPVVEKIYHKTKHYGNYPIDYMITRSFFEDCKINFRLTPEVNDSKIIEYLDSMWCIYSRYDAFTLAEYTNNLNTPWDITAKEYDYIMPKNITIENEKIKIYFDKLKFEIENK